MYEVVMDLFMWSFVVAASFYAGYSKGKTDQLKDHVRWVDENLRRIEGELQEILDPLTESELQEIEDPLTVTEKGEP